MSSFRQPFCLIAQVLSRVVHTPGTSCSPTTKQSQKKIENKPDEVFADFDFVRKEVEEQAQCVTDSKKRMCNETI